VVDLADVVSMAVETSRGYIDKRAHELTLSLPAEPILLKADGARVAQLFANLLNNAAKYTEPHGHIWLTAQRKENEVEVRVRDNGIGIAPEMLPHIFDLFTQADHALARSQGGLGIGLTLVRRIIELHGGTVRASSPGLGQGSEFTVRLPVPKRIFPARPSPHHTVATASRKRLRVLVVDDNVDTAAGMTKLLERSGHDVQTAYDGVSALETARSFKAEVVLLDIGLPNMDGYQVAAQLRQEEDLVGAVIVAVSGYGQETDRCRSRDAGFDHHLVKPIDFGALLALLAHLASPILA
jgi:CheY-like chemotaxis protein